jgi:xanthine dehydrogenase accessory protein pucB
MGAGRSKLQLPVNGQPLGSLALQAALTSRLDHIYVVVRADDPLAWIPPYLMQGSVSQRWTLVRCGQAGMGMSWSLRSAVEAAEQREAEAVLVMLADQPFVTAAMMDQLLEELYNRSPAVPVPEYCAFRYDGIIRPPVLFQRRCFAALRRLEGDQGARGLIRDAKLNGRIIEGEEASAFLDCDTPDDYEALVLAAQSIGIREGHR